MNLVQSLPADPFKAWRDGTITDGQVREFVYDAAGRLRKSRVPEQGGQTLPDAAWSWLDRYDAWGNLLAYRDPLAVDRGYFFENTYDPAGRLLTASKVRGTPDAPQTGDVDLLGADGGFEGGMGGWEAGTIDETGTEFTSGGSSWQVVSYGALSCVAAPDGGGASGLYIGGGCSYASLPSQGQAVRHLISNVSKDDVVTLKFWRQVREGAGSLDAFSVFVTLQGDDLSVVNRRYLLHLDETQSSFARWRQTEALRPADLFLDAEWQEGTTRNIFLYVVFEKGDTEQPGLGTGVVVDDVFVGRRGVEPLAANVYDEDICTAGEGGEACPSGTTNYPLGNLAKALSYQSGRLAEKEYFVYGGLNGRRSGERFFIDWAGVGQFDEWVARHTYSPTGMEWERYAPYMPGVDETRRYDYTYRRDFLDGIRQGETTLLESGTGALGYTPAGSLSHIGFANGTTTDIVRDAMDRVKSLTVNGPAGTPSPYWSTGDYRYDGAGNITWIGSQQFAYDPVGRLVAARLLPQAGNPQEAVAYEIGYGYDIYGNMTSRTWAHGSDGSPVGMAFSRTFESIPTSNQNQIQGADYRYDANGNLMRMIGTNDGRVAATWDSRDRMVAFYNGHPETGPHSVAERYLYDSGGNRIVRYPEAGDGRPVMSLRDPSDQVMSEFTQDPGQAHPILHKDFVYGVGQLLVERTVAADAPAMMMNAAMTSGGSYYFDVNDTIGSGPYQLDIRTDSGYQNQVLNVMPDGNGVVSVPEAEFALGETNYVRIRRSGEGEQYSIPVTIAIDPTVTSESENQVRTLTITRNENTLTVRWAQLEANGKRTYLYFQRGDNGNILPLTPGGLDPGVTEHTIASQSLASPKGSIYSTQSAVVSIAPCLPAWSGEVLSRQPSGCYDVVPDPPDPPDPPGSEPPFYAFDERFHHRDHLGSLRVVTDGGGWMVTGHDYYPFGMDMEVASGGTDGSRRRFTGHERDAQTGLDYMLARYYGTGLARFLAVDPARDETLGAGQAWNQYAYVGNNPLRVIDPNGRYGIDVHYYLTWYLARAAGKDVATAKQIAEDNQEVDRNHSAGEFWNRGDFHRHFMSTNEAVAAFRATGSGTDLHSVQDSFSHEGYGWPFGHIFATLFGNNPDDPWRDPGKAMTMATLTFSLLGGRSGDLDSAFLQILFRVHSQDERIAMIEEARHRLDGGLRGNLTIHVENFGDLMSLADYYHAKGYVVYVDGHLFY